MVKGCQRETIFVKCDENSRFESVFFVVKKDADISKRENILKEANAFIEEREDFNFKKPKKIFGRLPVLLFGLILGSAFTGTIIFLLTK